MAPDKPLVALSHSLCKRLLNTSQWQTLTSGLGILLRITQKVLGFMGDQSQEWVAAITKKRAIFKQTFQILVSVVRPTTRVVKLSGSAALDMQGPLKSDVLCWDLTGRKSQLCKAGYPEPLLPIVEKRRLDWGGWQWDPLGCFVVVVIVCESHGERDLNNLSSPLRTTTHMHITSCWFQNANIVL